MKFAKQLEEVRQQFLNEDLRSTCLPYKTWKKQLKYGRISSNEDAYRVLDEQYHTIASTCKKYIDHQNRIRPSRTRPSLFLSCCYAQYSRIDAQEKTNTLKELLTYMEINLQALYKICKKLEKNGHRGFMAHYHELRKRRDMAVNYHVSKIRLEVDPSFAQECPICMNDLTPQDTRVILKCGHIYCFDCMYHMLNLESIRATLINKMAIASRQWQCPMCRMQDPIPLNVSKAFYPTLPKCEQYR